jgi:D-serine deaminase-like pyridoxal phosphate-dependent protein
MVDQLGPTGQARPIESIRTPFVLIDGRVVEANLQRAATYTTEHHLRLRPHTKTHKMLHLARRQCALGAVGLTAAKPEEARIMAEATDDLLLAYPVVVEAGAAVLAELARRITIRAIADTLTGIECLQHAAQQAGVTIGVLIDMDLGMGRTGVTDPAAALHLARAVDRAEALRLDGLFVYPGQVWAKPEDQPQLLGELDQSIHNALALWERAGLSAAIVSGGSTPTLYQSHHMSALTEIRPGTYLFNDMNTVRGGFCELADCAARVVCTVVSDAAPGRFILDAGSKTLTSDRLIPADGRGHGLIIEHPGAVIEALSEEHGHVSLATESQSPGLGRRLSVIPNHICPCINLHEQVWWTTDGANAAPVVVSARGCVW